MPCNEFSLCCDHITVVLAGPVECAPALCHSGPGRDVYRAVIASRGALAGRGHERQRPSSAPQDGSGVQPEWDW